MVEDSAGKTGRTFEGARRGYLEGIYTSFDSSTQAGISMLSLREHPGYALQQAACLHGTMLACAITNLLPAAAAGPQAVACNQ